jgi:hypothetical protein
MHERRQRRKVRTLVAGQAQFIFQDIAVMMSVRSTEGARIKALAFTNEFLT